MSNTKTVVPSVPPELHEIRILARHQLDDRFGQWEKLLLERGTVALSAHPAWLKVLERGLGHIPYCLELVQGTRLKGFLPLVNVCSWIFGRFLVGLPYLNYGGPIVRDEADAHALLNQAVQLADELDVRYLELRETHPLDHPAFTHILSTKVHMKLKLPRDSETLWKNLDAKVRNQVRKGQKSDLTVTFGGIELLPQFFSVFSRNMRDLGTPVYSHRLFQATCETFPERSEFCVVLQKNLPVAGALLLHGWGVSEVPSASSLREFNHTNANMLMYWKLLERSIERKQMTFDFGRSTLDSNTHKFKAQWGAIPEQAVWQYYLRKGNIKSMRPESYGLAVQMWKRMPLPLAQWIGPRIIRGVP